MQALNSQSFPTSGRFVPRTFARKQKTSTVWAHHQPQRPQVLVTMSRWRLPRVPPPLRDPDDPSPRPLSSRPGPTPKPCSGRGHKQTIKDRVYFFFFTKIQMIQFQFRQFDRMLPQLQPPWPRRPGDPCCCSGRSGTSQSLTHCPRSDPQPAQPPGPSLRLYF